MYSMLKINEMYCMLKINEMYCMLKINEMYCMLNGREIRSIGRFYEKNADVFFLFLHLHLIFSSVGS